MLSQALLLGRMLAGWICITGGVILTISPLPFGFIIVLVGVALLGPRDRGLRLLRARWLRLVRLWAASPSPLLAGGARRVRMFQHTVESSARQWATTRARRSR